MQGITEPGPDQPPGGPTDAMTTTPHRPPRSARRTTSLDMTHTDGLQGQLIAEVRGRDLRTDADGEAEITDELALTVTFDIAGTVLAIDTTSGAGADGAALGALVGTNARSGFARRLQALVPEQAERRTLVWSALEDLNGALLVSGYSLLRGGLLLVSPESGAERAAAQEDICSGWAAGLPLVEALRSGGVNMTPFGPPAPSLERADDPLAWHPLPPLAPTAVRRLRRLDVILGDDERGGDAGGASVRADSHFRDSYAAPDHQMVMHEYHLEVTLDTAAEAIASVVAEARVLPWEACPGALGSAQRIVGTPVADLPALVRGELRGTTTCTHLNSTLRSLTDLRALATIAGLPGST